MIACCENKIMRSLVVLILIVLCNSAYAQYIDTVRELDRIDSLDKSNEIKIKDIVIPTSIMLGGYLIHSYAHESIDNDIRNYVQNELRSGHTICNFENVVQYVPMAFDLVGGFISDSMTDNPFIERAAALGFGFLLESGISQSIKAMVKTPRPSRPYSYASFPSGHTSVAFLGAELVRMDYGNLYGLGAYAIAGTVGYMRIYHDMHWASDVIFGAGVGILCAHLGAGLVDTIFDLLNINLDKKQLVLTPTVDPLSKTYCTTLSLKF